jgi:transcriptional regulator with XRE-family HTH domain
VLQKQLGQRIAALRKKQGLTQEALSEVIGCSVEFISLVERGVNSPSVAGLQGFADALDVEVRDLFTFDGRKPR